MWLILFRIPNAIHEEYANLLELEKLAKYLLKGFVELYVVALTENVLESCENLMRSVLVRSDRGLNEYAFNAIRCDLADEVH